MAYASVFKPELFKGQTIIVTGGGSGIGRCTGHELAALGAYVVLIGRKTQKLQQVCLEIEQDGGRAEYHSADIRAEALVTQVVARIIEKRGSIHGLVNNAGGQYPALLADISKKGFEAVVGTNLVGGFLMAREVYTQSMRQHGGSMVNMLADNWGGMPNMGHSGSARAGMENFTKTAAVEWASSGVRVNAVAPGWIASSGLDTYEGEMKAAIKSMQQKLPVKRMGTESEVSAAICFLLSAAAGFITGATLRIDGASSLGNRLWSLPEHQNSRAYNGFHRAVRPRVLDES